MYLVNYAKGHRLLVRSLTAVMLPTSMQHLNTITTINNQNESGDESGSTVKGTYFPQGPTEEPVTDNPGNGGTHHKFQIHVSKHLFPQSSYLGWEPPSPLMPEEAVIAEFLVSRPCAVFPSIDVRQEAQRPRRDTSSDGSSYTSFELSSFSIYRPTFKYNPGANRLAGEFAMLQDLCVRPGNNNYCFDGVLCDGQTKRYVQNVPFEKLSIGAYEDTNIPTVGSNIWIQSIRGAKAKTHRDGAWYRLRTPSAEYARFHQPFLWLADFAKHFVDYLKQHKNVSLQNFKQDFFLRLLNLHGNKLSFNQWAQAYGDHDFRRAVVAHSAFLQHEAFLLSDFYRSHRLWGEIGPSKQDLCAVPAQPIRQLKTLVTPLVFQCFENLAFARFLEAQEPVNHRGPIIPRLQDPVPLSPRSKRISRDPVLAVGSTKRVRVGDVVKLKRDHPSASNWTDNEEYWYAYVQRLEETNSGLRVIWLDSPLHTTCSTMHYPFQNELFMTDHCNCDASKPIPVGEVLAITSVAFFVGPSGSSTEFFVRQRFLRDTAAFEELKEGHFKCDCKKPTISKKYDDGDTVLIQKLESVDGPVLEPVELLSAVRSGVASVKVRRLPRRGRDFHGEAAQPNELVYTSVFEEVPVGNIDRACHIRFYTIAERDQGEIPPPYCRQGTGDAFYIIFEQTEPDHSLRPLIFPYPASLKQGFDPLEKSSLRRLRALDLFCGGGNFGRGIEEGGAIEVKWAVDYDAEAIHSYRANLADPSEVGLFFGSVNDSLKKAMNGQYCEIIARPGEVEIIIGGTPCPGYSNANNNRGDDKALKNNSLIASFAAYVDYYRPKYALLENVPNVAECSAKNRDKNVFSQMICAFVAMGYQVQQFLLDAWTCGSPQSRTRLFISIAAPGCTPLPPPSMSHSHPPGMGPRALGKAANGIKFGERILDAITPFRYNSLGEATSDLPPNTDARATSIRFPDHYCPRVEKTESRLQIACIPRFPRYSTLVSARAANLLPKTYIDARPNFWKSAKKSRKDSKAWQRNSAETLIPTVTTKVNPADSFTGRALHPVADRCLTLLEVRRAQGYPDRDVIVGSGAAQWRIVGNSVPRTVALALGMALREAWLANGRRLGAVPGGGFVDDCMMEGSAAVGEADSGVHEGTRGHKRKRDPHPSEDKSAIAPVRPRHVRTVVEEVTQVTRTTRVEYETMRDEPTNEGLPRRSSGDLVEEAMLVEVPEKGKGCGVGEESSGIAGGGGRRRKSGMSVEEAIVLD